MGRVINREVEKGEEVEEEMKKWGSLSSALFDFFDLAVRNFFVIGNHD
ncbi:hypothetical protein LQZ19_07725 [Treponema primitia]